jgi:hypothetical protein
MKSQFFDGEIMLNPYFWTIWTAQKFVPWLHGGTTRIHSFGKKNSPISGWLKQLEPWQQLPIFAGQNYESNNYDQQFLVNSG